MHNTITHWYLFSRPGDLQGALLQGESSVLLSPYQMFRFEQSGSGRCFLLLAVETHPLPPSPAIIPLFLLVREMKQYNLQREEGALHDNKTPLEAKPDTLRISLTTQDRQQTYTGWAFPLRQGQHLLAALGLTEVPAHTPLQGALFHVSANELRDVLEHHLALGRHTIRCSPEMDKKHWLLVRQPELYLLLKWKQTPGTRVYQSFSGTEQVMTPLGYQSPLASRLALPSSQTLLVMDLDGGSEWLDIRDWWQPSEMIALPPDMPQTMASSSQDPIKVVVKLRYLQAETEDIPRLWLLQGQDALAQLEQLVLDLPPAERDALQLFLGHSSTSSFLFVVKDDRLHVEAPLFMHQEATGFLPLLPDVNLFVQHGHRVQPILPAIVWKQELGLSVQEYTLLLPPIATQTSPSVLRWSTSAFVPFSSLIEYKLAGQRDELQPLVKTTAFELLFSPIELPFQQTALLTDRKSSAPKTPPSWTPSSLPEWTEPKPEPSLETAVSEVFKHSRGRRVTSPQLQRLELSVRHRNHKLNTVSPQDWLVLGRLYLEEYKSQTDNYWLGEAASCLDQVFRLDRQSETAVALEKELLEQGLQLKITDGFVSLLQQLDHHVQGNSPLHARFAFRYRVRLLMRGNVTGTDALLLRQRFYTDLARLEPSLLVTEHYIFVEGAAQWLDDQELLARAKQSFRKGLLDPQLLLQTLPAVARP